jgi:hypothetical protein
MKINYALGFLILFSALNQAQINSRFEKGLSTNHISWLSTTPGQPNWYGSNAGTKHYSTVVRKTNESLFPDTINTSLTDSVQYNMYGNLRNDDPVYNPKASLGTVILGVTLTNLTTNLVDRYILDYEWARVGFNTWSHNFQTGPEWDVDRFGMNYFFHPFSGSMFFNVGRSNGYSFVESVPFAFLGSMEWELFGENTLPSYNDFINTPINGSFLGEIFYRLGSNILDDRTTGFDRLTRELAVAFITPTRFFSRLINGKISRTTPGEVYQKEPLNITLSVGYHRVNEGVKIDNNGTNSLNINVHLDYGNPFEKRTRKPFDYFKLRTDMDFGVGRKIIDNITGYGFLFGKNVQLGNMEMLTGIFQHMNFFDNKTFELGTIAFGPGILSKLPITERTSLYTNLHLDLIPFGGLSGRHGPDTTQVRDYNYGGGAQVKLESNFNIGGWVSLTFIGYYWWFHTYIGESGNSYIGLIKPRITFNFWENVSIGFEHQVYYGDRYPTDFPEAHSVRTEQKIFVQIFLEQFKFKK